MFVEILARMHPERTVSPEARLFVDGMIARARQEIADGGVRREDGKVGSKGGIAAYSGPNAGSGFSINPYVILVEEGFNSRFPDDPKNADHVMETAQGIAEIGLQVPLEVYYCKLRKRIVLVGGHCRLDAIMYANLYLGTVIECVAVFVSLNKDNEERRSNAPATGNGVKQLSILELAAHVRRQMDITGKDYRAVAIGLGKMPETVKGWLDADDAIGPDIRKLVVRGNVALNTALAQLEKNGNDRAQTVRDITRGLEVSQTEGGKVKKAMPRHIAEGRAGMKVPPLKSGLNAMFTDRRITVHHEGGRVLYSMDPKVHETLGLMLNRKNIEVMPDPDGMDEPASDDARQ